MKKVSLKWCVAIPSPLRRQLFMRISRAAQTPLEMCIEYMGRGMAARSVTVAVDFLK